MGEMLQVGDRVAVRSGHHIQQPEITTRTPFPEFFVTRCSGKAQGLVGGRTTPSACIQRNTVLAASNLMGFSRLGRLNTGGPVVTMWYWVGAGGGTGPDLRGSSSWNLQSHGLRFWWGFRRRNSYMSSSSFVSQRTECNGGWSSRRLRRSGSRLKLDRKSAPRSDDEEPLETLPEPQIDSAFARSGNGNRGTVSCYRVFAYLHKCCQVGWW